MAAGPARAADRECVERRHRRRAPLSHLRLISIVAVATAAAVASTGCGQNDQEKVVPIMSCNLEAMAECDEFIGIGSIMNMSAAEHDCTYRGGSYSWTTRCPFTTMDRRGAPRCLAMIGIATAFGEARRTTCSPLGGWVASPATMVRCGPPRTAERRSVSTQSGDRRLPASSPSVKGERLCATRRDRWLGPGLPTLGLSCLPGCIGRGGPGDGSTSAGDPRRRSARSA